jgi:dihydrofolate reductase
VRKVVLYTLMALDGAVDVPTDYFLGGRDGGGPPEFDDVMEENEATVIGAEDAVLLGRHMYDEWSGFWPRQIDNPFADFINTVRKYVVTSTPLATEWANSEAIIGPISKTVGDLKSRPGRDIGVHGSIQLAQSLLAEGLVDELQLVIGPAFGFGGRRLFEQASGIRRLELLSARTTPSGTLLLAYRPR